MKTFFFSTILLTYIFCNVFADKNDSVFYYDWNRDGKPDQFVFTPFYSEYCPADFVEFKVIIFGIGEYKFEAIDSYWVMHTSDECFAPQKYIKSYNLLDSKYAALLDVKIKGKSSPLLFLFGFSPLNEPGWLDIYGLNKSGKPYNVKSEKIDLCDIIDLDKNGYSEVIFAPQHEYAENYYKQYHYNTYAPFYVYTITDSLTFNFNMNLTGLYNRKKYIGWVGLDSARQYIIWENPATKKHILTTLEKLRRSILNSTPCNNWESVSYSIP